MYTSASPKHVELECSRLEYTMGATILSWLSSIM